MPHRFLRILLFAAGLCALAGCTQEDAQPEVSLDLNSATYVGSAQCADCHQAQTVQWQQSHHAAAMQPLAAPGEQPGAASDDMNDAQATDSTRSSNFENEHLQVSLEGSVGATVTMADGQQYPITHTFGYAPLQQFLVDVGEGKLQVLDPAWQTEPHQGWLQLYPEATAPDDPLHWRQPGQNWNFMCADCHVTAYRKGYNRKARRYQPDFAEVGVGCEACHGPGSVHVNLFEQNDGTRGSSGSGLIVPGRTQPLVQVCGQCHSRREQLAEGYTPDQPLLDYYLPVLLDESLYHADGQINDEVYVYGSFLQSKMHGAGVTCSDCHNMHSGQLHQTGDDLCLSCHSPAGNPRFAELNKRAYDTQEHSFHDANNQVACVDCHMPSKTYMAVDERRDHSFRIPRPDLTVSLGVPNACQQCHQDKDAAWAAAYLKARGEVAAGHYGLALDGGRNGLTAWEPALTQMLNDTDSPEIVRATAAGLLAQFDTYGSSAALHAALRDSSPLVRVGALRGAQRWPAGERWRRIKPLLDDERLAVRVQAVRSLLPVYAELDAAAQQQLLPYTQTYLEVLELQSDRAEGLTNIAQVYQAQADLASAERVLVEATQLNQNWLPGWVNLADLYRQTGRDAQAGPLLDEAVLRGADQPDVLLSKALWLVRQQQREAALPLLQQAWQLAPGQGQYAYVYAVALHSLDRSSDALKLLLDALPQHADAAQLRNLAMNIARDSGDMAAMAQLLSTPAEP